MNRRYVTIPEIREIMERYNKILAPEEKLKFHVVTDHSYFTPRMKECHNVIVGKNVRFISFVGNRYYWVLEMQGKNVFTGFLDECIEKYRSIKNEL